MSDTLISYAQSLYQRGDSAGAATVVDKALEQSPPGTQAHRDLLYMKAHLAIHRNDMNAAAATLDVMTATYQQDAAAWDDRGVLYQMQRQYLKASECHMRAVEYAPHAEMPLLNLAIALNHLGQKQHAESLYRDVLKVNPNNHRALINLGIICDDTSRHDEAEKCLQQAAQQGDTSFELCMALGNLYRHRDNSAQAADWYKKALAARPDNPQAVFMLASVTGEAVPAPPPQHIAGLFDSFADTFETTLVEKLDYKSPQHLFALMEKDLAALQQKHGHLQAVDLGAGTGLFGKLLRPYVAQNVAVDLSQKMLDKAVAQNIYDRVILDDVHAALATFSDGSLHAVTAADVFVYLGDLEPVTALAAQKLLSGGLFAFTTEAMSADEAPPYVLRDTGRYAHRKSYLVELAARHGFKLSVCDTAFLRQNKGKPLDGFYIVLEKC